MSQSQDEIRRRLHSAQQNRQPVTIRRKHIDIDTTSGFIITLIDEWVVMQDLVEAVHLDDVILLRLNHVTKVEPHQDEEYVSRAVVGLGEPIQTFECEPDAAIRDLLGIIAKRVELVGVHLESPSGDWINFGRIHRIGEKRLDLQFIGRDGVWDDYVDAWKLKDITRIEFGGRYISALERFGDERPEVNSRKKR